MVEAVERKIDIIEAKPQLDIETIDFTIKDPSAVLHKLGPILVYFQRVEAMVTSASLEVLLPKSAGDYTGRFIHAWVRDEQVHGRAFDRLLQLIGMQGIEQPSDPIPIHNKIAGWVAGQNEWTHQVLEMVYHTTGALHEKLTAVGYKRLYNLLAQMGEHALAETMIAPIQKDEAVHLGYYKTVAGHLVNTLSPGQLRAARLLVQHTYAPVGAGAAQDKPAFGEVIEVLAAGESIDTMVAPIEAMAARFLPSSGKPTIFVTEAIKECVAKAA